MQPPPIDNLGNSSGFSFRLQDRGQRGYAELMRAKDQLLAAAAQSPVLQDVYVEGLSPAPQIELVVDREKAAALGVTFEEINNAISTNLGSAYINDFPNRGRMQRVIVQADRNARMQADQILTYNVRNTSGQLVPMSSFATVRWSVGPSQIVGFNYYPSVRLSGSAKPGYTSGDAIREMERLAARLPKGFGYEWAGQSLQEKLSGSQAPFLLMLSVLLVFLVLAALYESWTIPLSVLLTVPLGILGAVAAAMLRGLPNDVYFTVGIVTIIGLAAKDGILIIEFAKALREQGRSIRDATIEACRMRFRPIVMTGLAFVFGVAPMIIAAGASAKSQQALGTSRHGRDDRGGHPGAIDGSDLLRDGASLLQSRGETGASIRCCGRHRRARRRASRGRRARIAMKTRHQRLRSAAHGLATHRDNFGEDGDRDLVGRDGAEVEAGGRFELRQALGGNAALRQRRLQRFGFLAAADERHIGRIDGERGQQGCFITAPLGRHDHIARTRLRHRQCVAFDTAIRVREGRLIGRRRANRHCKPAPPCQIGDGDGHRA